MTARSFMGAGDIYINRLVGGISQGMVGPIYADKLEIKPSVDTKESTSKGRYSYGQVLETVNLAKPTEFTLDLKEVTGDILVMAFLGTSAALNQTSGALTDFLVTIKKDKWVGIGKKNLEATVTVEHATLATVYVEGTDYLLNRALGWIKVLPGSAIVDGVQLKVTADYSAATGTVISGSTLTEVRANIVFDGINQADGTQVTVDIFEAVVSADSAFDFLGNDFGNVSLKGKLKTPVGKTAPYTVTVQDPVV